MFLMHQDSSLSALFVRTKRRKFVNHLSRYWDLFLSTWNVSLHGNPARDVFGGINVAASGELGFGVGEEDRGSGEREVLEGLVGRIEGLVDLVVSKFGDYDPQSPPPVSPNGDPEQWLGTGQEPGPESGVIFLGTGALSRKSLRDVTHWMEDLYTWGDHAYGIIENPTSVRRVKRHRENCISSKGTEADPKQSTDAEDVLKLGEGDASGAANTDNVGATVNGPQSSEAEDGRLDKMVSYLKMGYGTYWSLPGTSSDSPDKTTPNAIIQQPDGRSREEEASKQASKQASRQAKRTPLGRTLSYEAQGHFLIGLKGEIETTYSDLDTQSSDDAGDVEHNSRTLVRTVNIELESEAAERPETTIVRDFEHPASAMTQSQVVGNMVPGYDSHDLNKAKKLRVVVYVNRPFMFTFLFNLRTDSLAMDALYHSLHHQLAPLRKQLLLSTRYRPVSDGTSSGSKGGSSIYDLIWDPSALTVHSTIPNIPEYSDSEPWSRADALNTHLHILNLYVSTRSRKKALERTEKSSRGWWIVWTRLLGRNDEPLSNSDLPTIRETGSDRGDDTSEAGNDTPEKGDRETSSQHSDITKEIILIRQASDHIGFRTDVSTGGGDGAGRLAHGIGVDTHRYIGELLSLL